MNIANVADVVIVNEDKILLVQQKKKSAFGLWSYPGGLVEDGEAIEQALVREVKEELDAELTNYKFLKAYEVTNNIGKLTIYTFVGEISSEINIKQDEIMAYGWFSIAELEGNLKNLRGDLVYVQAKDALDYLTRGKYDRVAK